ncbi:MAG: hypothetical protein V3V56_05805 [bacterium]
MNGNQNRNRAAALIFAAVFFLSGCATLISGRDQMIKIDTMNVKGAVCVGTDKEKRKYNWHSTPVQAKVIKGDGPINVVCEADGFEKTAFQIKEQLTGTLALNILTFGVGFLVDAGSGAAQPYPTMVRMPMKPAAGASRGLLDDYEEAIERAAEEAKREKEKLEKEIRSAAY